MLLLIISSIFIIIISWLLWTIWSRIKTCDKKRVCIVVLGDIGRSPRMQYHALSFMNEGYFVDIVGYSGSDPLEELKNSPNVNIHYLPDVPEWNNHLPQLISFIVKTLWHTVHLTRVLFTKVQASYLMMQNPPAIPTIPICWCYCRIFKMQFIIDWHNYAYSIMALKIKRDHLLVKITMFIESFFGKRADKNFCVTNAMKNDLNANWSIEYLKHIFSIKVLEQINGKISGEKTAKATVLYDRPPLAFKPIDLSEKHSLLTRLSKTYAEFRHDEEGSSALTECLANGEIQLREQRPALIVSSTSWTEDEDFSVLLNALNEYERECSRENSSLPNLICAITGKGPLKDFWTAIIRFKQWTHVKAVTPWLTNEDYPKLLASADLGICLHTSTSGLDLPMKVVDMFGCGLPVCALNFNCLNELVRHEENSLVFTNEQELSNQLIAWFNNFPNNQQQTERNKRFRRELEKFQNLRWAGNWRDVVLPCFD